MSSEAWEKAVEAGARAMYAAGGEIMGDDAPDDWNDIGPDHDRARAEWHRMSAATLRAAFPILAEELAGEIEQTAVMAERRSTAAHRVGDTATSTHERAIALGRMDAADFLRARIEQMKERG